MAEKSLTVSDIVRLYKDIFQTCSTWL